MSRDKLKAKASFGPIMNEDGCDNGAKSKPWSTSAIWTAGAECRHTTRVTSMDADPVVSLAFTSNGTPTTSPFATSCSFGVPYILRDLLSIDNHCGALERVYVSCVDGEKVEEENSKENGFPILATGGTWEFIGNVIVGVAAASPTRSSTAHGSIEYVMMRGTGTEQQ